MKKRLIFAAAATVLTVLLGASVAALAQTPVTACGQTVEGDAYLPADLDCSGFVSQDRTGAMIILLSPHGRLDLRGFTLTGGLYIGVSCVKPCRGTRCPGDIRPARCDVFDTVGGGVITGASYGISAQSVLVEDVTVSNHASAAITAQGRVVLRNATLSGNRVGVDFEGRQRLRVLAYDSTITGNEEFGIVGRRISLRDSTVTGNGFIPGCDPQNSQNRCADLCSLRRPRLRSSTCETSTGKPYFQGGFDWGVCLLD